MRQERVWYLVKMISELTLLFRWFTIRLVENLGLLNAPRPAAPAW